MYKMHTFLYHITHLLYKHTTFVYWNKIFYRLKAECFTKKIRKWTLVGRYTSSLVYVVKLNKQYAV